VPHQGAKAFRFGDCEADLEAGEVRRHGVKLRLPDQSLRVLAALLRRPGEVVTREELRRELWGDRFADYEAGINTAVKRLRDALSDSAETSRLIETLPRRGYRLLVPVEAVSPDPEPLKIESLAVLPLDNLTGDPTQDYFAAGMTDALITHMAKIRALRVVSRTSVLQFQHARAPLSEIARQLNVDAVVEGSVARAGNRVRISAQLVHGPTDRHLWAEEYERDITDVLLLQAEVAAAIARQIQVKLTPPEEARLATARFVKPAAYDAYLRGRFYWDRRTEDGMRKGLALFEQALREDPSYPVAYTGLAESYNMLAWWGLAAPHEVASRARDATIKALEIDAGVAEAHAAQGWTEFMYDWNWSAGERELRRAIELNSRYATGHQWYSHLLTYQGRFEEAFAQVDRSLELEPLSPVMNSSASLVYLLARRYDDTIARARRTIELYPHFPPPYLWLGWALINQGKCTDGIAALGESVRLSEGGPRYLATLAYGHAIAGDLPAARKGLEDLRDRTASGFVSAYDVAVVHAALGESEAAMTRLAAACDERAAWLMLAGVDSRLDALRSDQRFPALLSRVGLPEQHRRGGDRAPR
jgi:TolB-like protein/Tfp pilus assembly protein PilF